MRLKAGAPRTLLLGGLCCMVAGLVFARALPSLRVHVRPIYVKLGILPEISAGLGTATEVSVPPERG